MDDEKCQPLCFCYRRVNDNSMILEFIQARGENKDLFSRLVV